MRSFGLFFLIIFILSISHADEIDDLVLNGEYTQAIKLLRQHYSNDTDQPEYLFINGMSELSGENSASYFKDYINKSSNDSYVDDWAKLMLGKYYLAQRLYVTARKQLESIPGNSPLVPEANYLMGRCCLLSGEYKQAADIFKQTIDYFDNNRSGAITPNRQYFGYWARLGLADSYLAQSDYDSARRQYQELLQTEFEDDIYAMALLGLSETAAAYGDRDDAGRYSSLYRERYQAVIEPISDKQLTSPDISDSQPVKSSRSTMHRFYIQVGAFSRRDNAIRTSSLYKNSGYNVYMENFIENGKEFYRILIGGYNSKQQAEFIKSRLEKAAGEKYILLKR